MVEVALGQDSNVRVFECLAGPRGSRFLVSKPRVFEQNLMKNLPCSFNRTASCLTVYEIVSPCLMAVQIL